MDASLATARQSKRESLLVGHRLRCPRCHGLDDLLEYFVFDRPEAFAHELNVVYKCRAKVTLSDGTTERCRAIFSPAVEPSTEEEL